MASSQPLNFCSLQTLVDDKLTDTEQQYPVKNPAMQFLLEQVVLWLSEKRRTDTEHLVEIIFSSLSCCSGQETTCILNHISMVTKVDEMSQVNFCISLLPLIFFCFLDGIAMGNYSANHTEGIYYVCTLFCQNILPEF